MNCLVTCVFWWAGVGYQDVCPARVEVQYTTKEYYYVTVLQGPTTQFKDPKVDMKIYQRVNKKECNKLYEKEISR